MAWLTSDERRGRWTRAGLLRAAAGAGAAATGAAALAARGGDNASQAASADVDAEILNAFLLLERVQEGFYREALARARLSGELHSYAVAVGAQERHHVARLTKALGARAAAAPRTDFGEATSSPRRFGELAIELEEAAIALYVGQAPNLTQQAMTFAATLVSVEARQAAWIRNVVGVPPAPRAADPPRRGAEVLAGLRREGVLR
jgi:hypothetical protein